METVSTARLPKRPKAVIFDMDGVLFDTEKMYQKTLQLAVEGAGAFISREDLSKTVGLSWADCRHMLERMYAQHIPVDDLIENWLSRFDALAATGVPIKAGLFEMLDALDALSLPYAIATSANHQDAQRNLNAHNIAQRFKTVVAQGDCKATKPAPDPFLLAAERLNVHPSSCLAIEDSTHGVRSASTAGMMTVMVPDTVPAGPQEIELCVMVARDLHEVRAMLMGG